MKERAIIEIKRMRVTGGILIRVGAMAVGIRAWTCSKRRSGRYRGIEEDSEQSKLCEIEGGVGMMQERGRDGGGCASRAVRVQLPVRAKCSVIGLVSRGSVRCGRTRSK